MTQRQFDIENEKDMQDLWDILPDDVVRIYLEQIECFELPICMADFSDKPKDFFDTKYIKINWHDKTEITRPIQEATKEDFKKLCLFWDDNYAGKGVIGLLSSIDGESVCNRYYMEGGTWWTHCRRLTKQEIEELI